MPHDKNGQLLIEGDEVTLRCKIIGISPGVETACNVTAEPIERPEGETYIFQIAGNSKFYEKETELEEVPISSIPDFKEACNILRADILSLDKEAEALVGHGSIAERNAANGEVIANLKLAHRHLEDARMRLGKAIQHSESRESIFDIQKDPEKVGKLAFLRYRKAIDLEADAESDWKHMDAMGRKAWIAAGSAGAPISQ